MKCPSSHPDARRGGAGSGFSLMEVLVALLLLAIGLLGFAGMQVIGLRNNANTSLRTQASLLAYDIIERMRANRDSVALHHYDIALADSAPASPTTLAQQDIAYWLTTLGTTLPQGDGSIAVVVDAGAGTADVTVTLQWEERAQEHATDKTVSNRTLSFVYATRL